MTHPAQFEADGNVIYLGRKKTKAEALEAVREARAEHARSGQVRGAKSVRKRADRRPAEDRVHTGDAYLWFDSHFGSRRAELLGEQRLMVGVLFDAIKALTGSCVTQRHEAIRWFRDGGRGYLFSFATICDEFGIPIESARIDLLCRTQGHD